MNRAIASLAIMIAAAGSFYLLYTHLHAEGRHADAKRAEPVAFSFAVGEDTVPVSIPRRYFAIANVPEPAASTSGFTVLIDDRTLEPSSSSVREDAHTISIQYTAYRHGFLDVFLDPNHPNYYTKYSVEDKAFGLRRLKLPYNDYLPADRQDQSFLLARRVGQADQHDLLIECIKIHPSAEPQPCLMFVPLPNTVVGEVRFNAGRIADWREIEAATKRFSTSIGIDAPLIKAR